MERRIRVKLMRRLTYIGVAVMGLLLLLVLHPWVNYILLPGTRFYYGKHRAFFLRCASLPRGATAREVLTSMNGYTLAATNETVDARVAAVTTPTPDDGARSYGADSSLLILPEKPDPADWCVCYFRSNRLVKTVVSPD